MLNNCPSFLLSVQSHRVQLRQQELGLVPPSSSWYLQPRQEVSPPPSSPRSARQAWRDSPPSWASAASPQGSRARALSRPFQSPKVRLLESSSNFPCYVPEAVLACADVPHLLKMLLLYMWYFRGGFIFANFASQSSQKFPLLYMAISNENIAKIAKLSHREYIPFSSWKYLYANIWRIQYSNISTAIRHYHDNG